MTTIKKEDLEIRLQETRDGFVKDSFNATTSRTISKVFLGGYIASLRDTGFVTTEEYDKMIKEWVE